MAELRDEHFEVISENKAKAHEQQKGMRDELMSYLKDKGIETRPMFYPIHTMPMYFKQYVPLPVCENISKRGLSLPSYPLLTDEEIGIISETLKKFFER